MIGKLIFSSVVAFLSTYAFAETTPIKAPVKLVVPFGPGGTTDIIARIISDKLSEEIKQPVIIENKPGAGGSIGAAQVAKSSPDGLTLGLTTVTTNASNHVFFADIPYHPLRDFEYVITIAATPKVFVARSDFPANNIKNLTSVVIKNPNKFSYGAAAGGVDYLYGETFKKLSNIELVFVSYKGGAPALQDLLGGHINLMVDNLPLVLPHVQSGTVKLLAISWPTRLKEFPNVPTWAELGYPQLNTYAWYGLSLPKGTPKHIVEFYNAAMKRVLADPVVQDKLRNNIAYVIADTPEQAYRTVEETLIRLEKMAYDLNLVKNTQGK